MKRFSIGILVSYFILFAAGAFAQTSCSNDSVVVSYRYSDIAVPSGLIITTTAYDLDSGTVTTTSQSGLPWSTSGTQYNFWTKVDTVFDGTGHVRELLTLNGSATGWQNDLLRVRYFDQVSGYNVFEADLDWVAGAWDTLSVIERTVGMLGELVDESSFTFVGGVREKKQRTVYTYIDGHINDLTIQHGSAGNWQNDSLYQFSYSGTVRTALAFSTWDSLAANWHFLSLSPYLLQTGEWCAERKVVPPVQLSGAIVFDTVQWFLDTLQRTVYISEFHCTGVDTTGGVVRVTESSQLTRDFSQGTGGVLLLSVAVDGEYILDVDSVWYPSSRPYRAIYTYDTLNRCISIIGSGGCTNPCGNDIYYTYGPDGYVSDTHSRTWSMVLEVNRYYHDDRFPPGVMDLVIPWWELQPQICPNTEYQPNLVIAGGCPPYFVRWFPSDGLSSDTLLNPVIRVTAYQAYSIIISDSQGLTDTSVFSINVPFSVRITGATNVCDTLRTFQVDSLAGVTYQWYLHEQPIAGANGTTLYADSAGSYYLLANGSGDSDIFGPFSCESSSDTFLIIPHAPLQAAAGAMVTVCAGDTVQLGGQPAGSGGIGMLAYAWSPGVSLDNDSIEHPLAFPQASGQYVLIVTDSLGCVAQDSVWLEVPIVPVPDIQQLGDSLYTTATAAGYQWYRDDTLIAGATDAYLLPTTAGTYQLSVTDTNGCSVRSVDFAFVPTGLASVYAGKGAVLYPNPADASVQLRLDRPAMTGVVRMFDLSGRLCYERSFEGGQAVLDVRSLVPGSYRVQVTADGMQSLSRLVVSR